METMTGKINKEEYERLLIENQSIIKNYALYLCKNLQEAEDLLQEVNIKVLESFDKYNHEYKFKNWLMLIVRNMFINNYRKYKKQNNVHIDIDPYQLKDSIPVSEFADSDINYNELIDIIKSDNNSLLILGFLNGYKYKELCEIFEIPEGTIKSKIYFTRKRLQKKLNIINNQ